MEIDIRIGSARLVLDPPMMTGSRGLVEVHPSGTVADITKVVVAACRALGTDEALDLAHDRQGRRVMAEPTEADRERARRIVAAHKHHGDLDELEHGIARAFADERERAFNEGALAGMSLVRENRAAEETGQ